MKRKIAMFLAPVVAAGSVFAEGETNPFDLSGATTAATNLGTAVSGLFTNGIQPAVITVVAAALAIWGIFVVVRYVRRAGR